MDPYWDNLSEKKELEFFYPLSVSNFIHNAIIIIIIIALILNVGMEIFIHW